MDMVLQNRHMWPICPGDTGATIRKCDDQNVPTEGGNLRVGGMSKSDTHRLMQASGWPAGFQIRCQLAMIAPPDTGFRGAEHDEPGCPMEALGRGGVPGDPGGRR
jgi:hypothetical protein